MNKLRTTSEPVIIPYREISVGALRGLVESFVLREGTEYGPKEVPLDIKRAQVMRLLEQGTAQIVFNPETESTDIELVRVRIRNGRAIADANVKIK